jgi:hypothetical protein
MHELRGGQPGFTSWDQKLSPTTLTGVHPP